MKVGAIVLCRYNSSRLPGKILRHIKGKPIIEYIVERLSKVVALDDIIITTSKEKSDDPIINYCKENNIKYFRGSLENVAQRFLECALHFDLTYAIRINGDNLFADSETISKLVEIAKANTYNFISNVKGRTFPKGMSVEIVELEFYKKWYQKFTTKYYQEHVTIYFYENEPEGNYYFLENKVLPQAAGIQLAIDTLDDFELAKKIISNFSQNHTTYNFKAIYQIYFNLTHTSIPANKP